MPDNDKVHPKLTGHFQKSYKLACDERTSSEELVDSVVQALKKHVLYYDNGPLELIRQVAGRLSERISGPLFCGSLNLAEEFKEIDKLKRRIYGNARGMDLAVKACRQLIYNIALGIYPTDWLASSDSLYVSQVYKDDFQDKLFLQTPYNGADPNAVEARVGEAEECLGPQIDKLGVRISRVSSVQELRLPASLNRKVEESVAALLMETVEDTNGIL